MFTLIGKQGVKSDRGFIVQIWNRFEIKYTEDLGEIDILYDSNYAGVSEVYVSEIDFYRWNDGRKISEQKKCEILKNFVEAMKYLKIAVVVE